MNLKKFYGSLIVFYFSDMSLLIMSCGCLINSPKIR
ncbi:Uncharacterised protein [Moraxella caviae]|nr:Uncharacterised protein [Moraxella caviae]